MNCKPGDLAIVVGFSATPEMFGHLVTVLVWIPTGATCPSGRPAEYAGWWCKSEHSGGIPVRNPGCALKFVQERLICDAYLRPIRPGDLEDETPTVRELEAA